MISNYLAELARDLRFDPALSRCVVQEVEDHLHEAAAACRAESRAEAERRAVAHFGTSRALAAEFAVMSLAQRTRLLGAAVIVVTLAILVAMKVRIAWYAAVQWSLNEDLRPIADIVVSIDRFAFWAAAVMGIAALLHMARHRALASNEACCARMRGTFLLCVGAGSAIAVSVICDALLTALQVSANLSAGAIIPIMLVALEIACAGLILFLLAGTRRRAMAVAALLET